MRTYRGHEFKRAVTLAIHKICADLGRDPVQIEWGGTQSASITLRGHLKLANVRDDAVLTKADLMRYVGYGVHELLHCIPLFSQSIHVDTRQSKCHWPRVCNQSLPRRPSV